MEKLPPYGVKVQPCSKNTPFFFSPAAKNKTPPNRLRREKAPQQKCLQRNVLRSSNCVLRRAATRLLRRVLCMCLISRQMKHIIHDGGTAQHLCCFPFAVLRCPTPFRLVVSPFVSCIGFFAFLFASLLSLVADSVVLSRCYTPPALLSSICVFPLRAVVFLAFLLFFLFIFLLFLPFFDFDFDQG